MSERKGSETSLRFHTVEQTAEILQVSTRTVRRWIAEGELAAYRFGRQLRIGEKELQSFANNGRIS